MKRYAIVVTNEPGFWSSHIAIKCEQLIKTEDNKFIADGMEIEIGRGLEIEDVLEIPLNGEVSDLI